MTRAPARRRRSPQAAAIDRERALAFSRKLRAWFRKNARDLPWRDTRDPYEILVSELMLQQTQVSRVLDFYPRFLSQFPTLGDLARAEPKRVRESWEGLGYYARARNLHELARQVTRDDDGWGGGGELPEHPAELRALPGVGAYTAGAVASFAYEQRVATVDTNVARVLSRAFAPKLRPKRGRDLKRIWEIAERTLPRTGKSTWEHNQALMELGALVCTARVARCEGCPVRQECTTGSSTTKSAGKSGAGVNGAGNKGAGARAERNATSGHHHTMERSE